MRTSDVFVAGGMPDITYIARSELGLEISLKGLVDTRYKLISVTGPTKSGKFNIQLFNHLQMSSL